MREFLEVRVDIEHFEELFTADEGKLGEHVFVGRLDTRDPRILKLATLQAERRAKGQSFFYGWEYIRQYTPRELDSAELFTFTITRHVEPTGEECGTLYDESRACSHCGFGRRLESVLRLDLVSLPKSSDFAQTIARDEQVASGRTVRSLAEAGVRGCEFLPVVHRRSDAEWESRNLTKLVAGRALLQRAEAAKAPFPTPEFWRWVAEPEQQPTVEQLQAELSSTKGRPDLPPWFQVVPVSKCVEVVVQTRFGDGPFDELLGTSVPPCPSGHLRGLNLLSELHLRRATWDGSDFGVTDLAVGAKRGLRRPCQMMLISQRFRRALVRLKAKGYVLEVAHLH